MQGQSLKASAYHAILIPIPKVLNHVNDSVNCYDHVTSVVDELMSLEDRWNDSDRVK